MKMKKKFMLITLVCMCLMLGVTFGYSQLLEIKGAKEFSQMGEGVSKSVHQLLKQNSNGLRTKQGYMTMTAKDDDVMCKVLGIQINKTYFDFKYESYKTSALNYANPKASAWDAIKTQVWEEQFAESNGILPTKSDIEIYVRDTRQAYEETGEGRILIQSYCDGMGLSEEEYWEFNKVYEAPLALIHQNVGTYLEENHMTMPNVDQIDAEILDQEYFESLK